MRANWGPSLCMLPPLPWDPLQALQLQPHLVLAVAMRECSREPSSIVHRAPEVVVHAAGLGEEALDAGRRGRAAQPLACHASQMGQPLRTGQLRVGRLVVVRSYRERMVDPANSWLARLGTLTEAARRSAGAANPLRNEALMSGARTAARPRRAPRRHIAQSRAERLSARSA